MVAQKEEPVRKSVETIWDIALPVFERYTGCDGYQLSMNDEASMEEIFKGNAEEYRKALLEIADKLGITLNITLGLEFVKCKTFHDFSYSFYMKLFENQDMWEERLLKKYGGRWSEETLPPINT